MAERDEQIVSLLDGLAAAEARPGAWREFLDSYSSIILQVVRHYEPDDDRSGDCYVFVCEQLFRNGCRRLCRFDPNGPAKFTTWLRVVTRNLYLDWRRRQAGRPRMFQAVSRMPDLEQEVFDCLYLKGLSPEETLAHLQIERAELTRHDLTAATNNLNQAMTSRQFWLLSTRAPQEISLEGRATGNGPFLPIPVTDQNPNPEEITRERELLRQVRSGYAELSPRQRLLIRLRYEKELSLEQIGRITNMNNRQQVDRELKKAMEKLQEATTGKDNKKSCP